MIAIMIEIVVDFQNIEHGLIILGLTMYYPCSETLSLLLWECAGNSFVVPGATVATILMLGVLHARRLYEDKKVHFLQLLMHILC